LANSKSRLNKIIFKINSVEESISEESKLLAFEKEVNRLLALLETKHQKNKEFVVLIGMLEDIEFVDIKIRNFNRIVKLEKNVNIILKQIADKRDFLQRHKLLTGQLYSLLTLNKKLLKTQENKANLEKQFKIYFPSICPLCGTPKKEIKL
jgi:hypothetical protein